MKAIIIDGYIFGLSEINGVDISAEREEEIRLAVREKPLVGGGRICISSYRGPDLGVI